MKEMCLNFSEQCMCWHALLSSHDFCHTGLAGLVFYEEGFQPPTQCQQMIENVNIFYVSKNRFSMTKINTPFSLSNTITVVTSHQNSLFCWPLLNTIWLRAAWHVDSEGVGWQSHTQLFTHNSNHMEMSIHQICTNFCTCHCGVYRCVKYLTIICVKTVIFVKFDWWLNPSHHWHGPQVVIIRKKFQWLWLNSLRLSDAYMRQ